MSETKEPVDEELVDQLFNIGIMYAILAAFFAAALCYLIKHRDIIARETRDENR